MEQKLSITQTQRLLKESVGDVYEILKEDPSFPRHIRRGSRTYFIEKEIFNWLDELEKKNKEDLFNDKYKIQEETFKFLKIVEALEDDIKEFAIPLLHIAADSGSNEELTKAVGALIWKLERTKVKHSSKIFLNLIGQGFTDVQKDEIKSIYKEIAEKISSQTLPSAFYDFMKSTMSEDESTIQTRIIKLEFVVFLREYFKVSYVNGLLSYWNGSKYLRGRSKLKALILSIEMFFEIEEFLSAKKIINHDLTEYLLRHSRI